ncbi:MAG: hypothetical protein EBS17_08350, partial [Flavobacteriia bacterium]|nr:hypothetical protein [Flavobacteriia bacterium]
GFCPPKRSPDLYLAPRANVVFFFACTPPSPNPFRSLFREPARAHRGYKEDPRCFPPFSLILRAFRLSYPPLWKPLGLTCF